MLGVHMHLFGASLSGAFHFPRGASHESLSMCRIPVNNHHPDADPGSCQNFNKYFSIIAAQICLISHFNYSNSSS